MVIDGELIRFRFLDEPKTASETNPGISKISIVGHKQMHFGGQQKSRNGFNGKSRSHWIWDFNKGKYVFSEKGRQLDEYLPNTTEEDDELILDR